MNKKEGNYRMNIEEKKVKNIQSIHRALDILEFLVENGTGTKLSEIAEHCNLNKTTAFHIVKTLESRNYIEQSPDSLKYKTGGKLFTIGFAAYKGIDLNKICQPYMERLLQTYNETVSLYHYCKMENGMMALCISCMESDHSVHVSTAVGKLLPLTNTAVGKLYLSALSEDRLAPILEAEHAAPGLRDQLASIRKDHYCVEREEYEDGVVNIAVPIYKYSGRVMAVICISIPVHRVSEDLIQKISADMLPISRTLSSLSL